MSQISLVVVVEIDDNKIDALRSWYRGLPSHMNTPADELAKAVVENAIEREMDVEDSEAIDAMEAITGYTVTISNPGVTP